MARAAARNQRLAWRAGPEADLHRLPVSLDLEAISLLEGLRAALAVTALVLLNEWAQVPALMEAALGALLTCLGDAGGPIRRRVPPLLAFAALGAGLTTGFGLLRPLGLPVVVPLATAVIFVAGFARVWGQAPMQVGNLLIVVTVLSLDRIEPRATALLLGGAFAVGSLWAILLTMVLWRLHPFRPARRALADLFRRLGALVADLAGLLDDPAKADWAAHARAHRRHVRDGIERARTLIFDTMRARGGGGGLRANQSVIQVEAADQLFGTLIALSDVLEYADVDTRAAAAKALPALRLLLAAVADATARDLPRDDPAAREITEHLLAAFAELERVPSLSALVPAIVARLRVALLLTTPEGLTPGQDGTGAPQPLLERVLAPVRANARWSSAVLRHAARIATMAGPALAVTLWVGHEYAHWLTITLVLTMQPFFATTWQRALERGAGTALGGVAAAAIATLVHTPLATAAVLAPLLVIAFAVRTVSFGLFMTCMTPLVVLLSELGRPGESELVIAGYRALFIVAGGGLAVLGNALLWPSWESGRVQQALTTALGAHAAYTDLELAALTDPATDEAAVEAARRAAGLACNNLETALNRALHEPRSQAAQETETALAIDAALRRLAGRLLALQHDPAQAGGDKGLLREWRGWAARAFAALQDGAPLPGPPPGRDHQALGRMGRQITLIAGVRAKPL